MGLKLSIKKNQKIFIRHNDIEGILELTLIRANGSWAGVEFNGKDFTINRDEKQKQKILRTKDEKG